MKKPKCVKQTKTPFHFNFKAEDSAKTIPYSRKSTLRDTTCTSYSPKKENVRQVLIQIGKTCALYLSVEIGTSNKATVVVPTIHEVTDAWKAK